LLSGAIILAVAAQVCIAALRITGAGATFPYPIYSKWFDEYHKLHPEIEVNYQSIGSGGGIRQVTPEAVAGIFLGKITKWNDPELVKVNPGAGLPDAGIVVAHRADGSGTTYVWTDYLSKVSDDWAKTVGKGTAVKWPVGLGGKGNEGVAAIIKNTPNSIGYVELIYALRSDMPFGEVRNKAGKFIKADLTSASVAAAGVEMPDDFRVSITNSAAPAAYPISSFTWLLIPEKISDPAKKTAITGLLKWVLTTGQGMTSNLSYAPLPKVVVQKELKAISLVQ
jgi:phosphate transport system substrate-binding protein